VQPNLPPDFIGNSALYATSKITDLVSSTSTSNLGYLASLIRASILAVDHESVSRDVAALGSLKSMSEVEWATSSDCDAGISSWTRFNHVRLDWGDELRCNALRIMNGHEGMMNLSTPAGDDGSIEISVT
jgi:hypothetical protein